MSIRSVAQVLLITIIAMLPHHLEIKAQEWVIPFESIQSPVLTDKVRDAAAEARVIGLGECTHFTKECYLMKREIMETLIASGYHGLVLEVDFGQALIWDAYVANGIGDLDSIVSASGWFTYRTEEFKAFLKMLHEHNATAKKKFHIFGMEMTAVNHNINWLLEYVKSSEIENEELVERLATEMPTVAFGQHSFDESTHYWKLTHMVGKFLTSHKKTLTERLGEQEYAIAEKISGIFRQYATYVSQSDNSLKSEFRDQFSARNVMWCLDFLGDGSKLAIWAHNGHVTKSALANYDVLGNHLSRWLGDQYLSIGFTMGQGEFRAFSAEGFERREVKTTNEPSITLTLKRLDSPFVFVDVRGGLAQDKSPDLFLRREMQIQRDYGESYNSAWPQLVPINLSRSYDALIYIDQGTLPTAIEWKRQ